MAPRPAQAGGPQRDVPAFVIDRPRLVDAIEGARDRRVTLLVGRSGSGKSVALRQWAARPRTRPLVWIEVDKSNVDAVILARQLVSALAALGPGFGEEVLRRLELGGLRFGRAFIEQLIAELAAVGDVDVVFEDVHDLPVALQDDLSRILEALPANVRVVIATQTDVALDLAGLHAAGQVREIRSDELAFTAEETARVVADRAGGRIPTGEIERLQAMTEGWVVGVHLAAAALQGSTPGEARAYLDGFAGTTAAVADYLVEEVYQPQPSHLRAFLAATSVVDVFDAELADAITGGSDAAVLIDELDRRDLFLIPLDGRPGWYRYHQLLRDALRRHHEHTAPDAHRQGLTAAARWHIARGDLVIGIDELIRAKRWQEALEVIGVNSWELYERGAAATVARWLESVPSAERWRHKDAAIALPLLLLNIGHPARANSLLQEVAVHPDAGDHRLMAMHALLATQSTWTSPPETTIQHAEQARALLWSLPPESDLIPGDYPPDWIEGATWLHHAQALHQLGDLAAARATLDGAMDMCKPYTGWRIRAHGLRCRIDAAEGNLHAAEMDGLYAVRLDAEADHPDETALAGAFLALAEIAYERSRLDEVYALLAEADIRARLNARSYFIAHVIALQARLALARHRPEDGLAIVTQWRRSGDPSTCPDVVANLTSTEARLLVATGDLDRAKRVLARSPHHDLTLAAAAHITVAEGDLDGLGLTLDRWRPGPGLRARIQHRAWSGYLAGTRGDDATAAASWHAAVALAEPEGHRRALVDLGASVLTLLTSLAGSASPEDTFVQEVVLAAAVDARPEVPALSGRELEVLQLLPSPMDNTEIAAHLGISPNTLKTYLRRLYRKLGVTSRREATRRAGQLGLAPARA